MKKQTNFYEALDSGRIQCTLCPADCRLKEGQRGICRSRFNENGQLYTDNYGELVTLAIDPIEKKPLYHFHPGTDILSTGPNCCNLQCRHCQNWSISQERFPTSYCSPEQLVMLAGRDGSIGVAFTYTEPMMWFEYIRDTAPLLQEHGYRVVLVTNAYIHAGPLAELLRHIDAANVDLKGMRPEFYRRVCKGKLQPVLDNIQAIRDHGVHLEVTNLVIPGYNDSEDDLNALVDFVASVSPRIPLHFSAYHPDYKLNAPPTAPQTIARALAIGREKLDYCFAGNIYIAGGSESICPACGHVLIERSGRAARITGLLESRCASCGEETGVIR
jgi:pyruvate formate lyase activating enzyme